MKKSLFISLILSACFFVTGLNIAHATPFDDYISSRFSALSKPNITTFTTIDGKPWASVTVGNTTVVATDNGATLHLMNWDTNTMTPINSDWTSKGQTCTIWSTCDTATNTLAVTAIQSWPIKIFTTELIPGAKCVCVATSTRWTEGEACTGPVEKRRYECTVQPWLGSFQTMFASIIRYLINIVLLLWVLAIAWLGVAWTWAGWDDAKMKSALKKWWVNIVVGLIILFLFRYILGFLAPWIYQ